MKLKNLVLFVALVALSSSIIGNPVDVNTAKKAAATFASSISNTKGAQDMTLVYTATNETKSQNFYYVFNYETGFVMVASDDIIMPVLAYSNENPFITENLPEHISAFLKDYELIIQDILDHETVSAPEVAMEWKNLVSGTYQATKGTNEVNSLLTDTWGQAGTSKPTYNAKCPSSNGKYAVTGCMATVLSQIMRYHKYPNKGVGSHSYTPERFGNRYGKLTCNFAATTFDFNNMPNKLTASSSEAQINAVATLMFAAGVGVEMDYGTSEDGGSGAALEEVVGKIHSGQYALKQYFDYPLATVISRTVMGDANFLATIKANLDKSLPVAITGFDGNQENGHIFACDGYDAQNRLSINWGWDGGCNGYYALGGFTPRSGGNSYNFNYNNQAMVNIIPGNKIASMVNNCLVLNGLSKAEPTSIPCGSAFKVTAKIKNKGGQTFNGSLRAFVAQGNMAELKLIGTTNATIAVGATTDVAFNSSGVEGVYTGSNYIMIEYQPSGSSSWVRVAGYGDYPMPLTATFTGDTKVATRQPYNITSTSATVWAKIEPGCAYIASRGFEYKKASDNNYQITYDKPNASNEITHNLTGLSPNTTYKVRVWCLMNGQRQYTNDQTFTTRSTGIEDITFGDVTVYPNPAKDKLNIDLTASSQKVDKIELINSLGQSLYLINSPANTLYTIPTGHYSNGLYFIRLSSTEGVTTKKVLISK